MFNIFNSSQEDQLYLLDSESWAENTARLTNTVSWFSVHQIFLFLLQAVRSQAHYSQQTKATTSWSQTYIIKYINPLITHEKASKYTVNGCCNVPKYQSFGVNWQLKSNGGLKQTTGHLCCEPQLPPRLATSPDSCSAEFPQNQPILAREFPNCQWCPPPETNSFFMGFTP